MLLLHNTLRLFRKVVGILMLDPKFQVCVGGIVVKL